MKRLNNIRNKIVSQSYKISIICHAANRVILDKIGNRIDVNCDSAVLRIFCRFFQFFMAKDNVLYGYVRTLLFFFLSFFLYFFSFSMSMLDISDVAK